MCRFLAYKGNTPVILKSLLSEMPNSLISQSRTSRERNSGLNGDGFGVGWYEREIDEIPAVFKSIQPAWNDSNLINISSKVRSSCFVGHVRASTVGDVSHANCHPFVFKNLLFAHNGTVHHFEKIKKRLIVCLEEEFFNSIKGQTDSEHFFLLVSSLIESESKVHGSCSLAKGLSLGLEKIDALFDECRLERNYRINAVLTNGKEMAAIRYNSQITQPSLSLYYTHHTGPKENESVIIASERLTDLREEWEEIPINSMLTIDENMKINIQKISNSTNLEGY